MHVRLRKAISVRKGKPQVQQSISVAEVADADPEKRPKAGRMMGETVNLFVRGSSSPPGIISYMPIVV